MTRITPKWIYTEYTVLKFFHHSAFSSNLRLPWKTEFALKIFTVLNIFFANQDFWATLRLPWKTVCALKFLTVLNILFTFKVFEQFALALKNRVCPEFTVFNIYFYHSGFWATCPCPEKQSLPWIHCVEIFFIIQDFWATCACPEKQSLPWIHCVEIFFIIQDFWATCACPEKQTLPWKFSSRSGGSSSAARLARLCHYCFGEVCWHNIRAILHALSLLVAVQCVTVII